MLPADRRTHEEAKAAANRTRGFSNYAGTVRGMRYEMLGFMQQCVERSVATPGIDDRSFGVEDWTESGRLAPIAAKVMEILYAARTYRFDLLHSVNSLARDITRWRRACG